MTERFTYDKPLVAFSKGGINDNVTGETYEFTMDTVLDLLNELHEENEYLRHQLITLDGLYVSDKEDMSDCWRLDLFSDEEKEVIAYLQAYHQGNVKEIRK